MDLKELQEIVRLFEEADISEMEVEKEGLRIHLKKGTQNSQPLPPFPFVQVSSPPLPVSSAHWQEQVNQEENRQGHETINSPMVGTFYRAPHPGAKPFVEVGDEVDEEKTVCVVEAMKLMNEIRAERKGRIAGILADNGRPVQYGQPLFLIETLPT